MQHCAQTPQRVLPAQHGHRVGVQLGRFHAGQRTTATCRSLDGSKFPVDKGPEASAASRMPQHDHSGAGRAFDVLDRGATRASKRPERRGASPASQTYYEWLKTQPAEFQDIAIRTTRAKLLRSGSLSAERFAEVTARNQFSTTDPG